MALIAATAVLTSAAWVPVTAKFAVVKVPALVVIATLPVSPAVIAAAGPAVLAAVYSVPSAEVLALATEDTVIVWPTLAPTWKVAPWNVPSSRFTPLNAAVEATL